MEGEIIFQGTFRNDIKILIRCIDKCDAEAMCQFINTLSLEHTYIRFQGEQMSIEEEDKFLAEQLRKIQNSQAVHLLAFCGAELIGTASVTMLDKTDSHVGLFGISLKKEYRKLGIGKILMKTAINLAEKRIPKLRIITLYIFSDNEVARKMYKNFGFIEYGRLPEGSCRQGKYYDLISMYKKIK